MSEAPGLIAVAPNLRRAVVAAMLLGAVAAVVVSALIVFMPDGLTGLEQRPDAWILALFLVAAFFLGLGGIVAAVRLGRGGAIALLGALFWLAGLIALKSLDWLLALPLAIGLMGALTALVAHDRAAAKVLPNLIYRQAVLTRVTHWIWAVSLFFLMASGLQIFNARPNLYIGQESGFSYSNDILAIGVVADEAGRPRGQTRLFGQEFDTTGVLGVSGSADSPSFTAFPGWATVPSFRDLGTGRVVHFFFAWVLVGTLALWLGNAVATGHLWRDIVLKPRDLRALPADVVDHLRLRFRHGRSYTPLQKLAYFSIFAVAFPVIILTGITMSPGMDAAWPWLLDLFGGRQTARTLHFVAMLFFVLFFIVHMLMVVLAGPINELRSMITGYIKVDTEPEEEAK